MKKFFGKKGVLPKKNGGDFLSFRYNITQNFFFKELSLEKQKKFFNYKKDKVISHIDTLYYTVYLKNDFIGNVSDSIIEFVEVLKECRNVVTETNEEIYFNTDLELLYTKKRFKLYNHCISRVGFFDIFVAESLPNEKTPRILVQIRSRSLWTLGDVESVKQSFKAILFLAQDFGFDVDKVVENRLDYCYHTNLIQNMSSIFCDTYIEKYLFGKMVRRGDERYKMMKVFTFNDESSIDTETFSIGSRRSVNLFFRSYNKVKEVIQMGYKDFFLEYWFSIGLINFYDYYCYNYAYVRKRYSAIYEARLRFYLEFGLNENKKEYFNKVLNSKNVTADDIKKVSKCLPDNTLIVNVEFQTMRNFYNNGDNIIDTLPVTSDFDEPLLLRLFQILDNRKLFTDYLTQHTVYFASDNKTKKFTYWWNKIVTCKIDRNVNLNYKREYLIFPNIDRIKRKIKSDLATLSVLNGDFYTDINQDLSLLYSVFNDNDCEEKEGIITFNDDEYMSYKNKKMKAYKNIVKPPDLND